MIHGLLFLRADWDPEPPTAANDDGGRKKWLIKQQVRDEGGGLLMFLDAEDWVASDLVRRARATIGPETVGAIISAGYAIGLPEWSHPAVSDRRRVR